MAVEEKGNGIAELGTEVAGKENEIAELGDAILVYSKPMGSNNTELDRENVEVVADSFESIEAVDKSRELNANHLVGNAVEKPIEKSTNNCRQLIPAVLCSTNETLGIAATDGCIECSNLQVNWDLAHMPKSLEIPRAITSVGLNHRNSVESRWRCLSEICWLLVVVVWMISYAYWVLEFLWNATLAAIDKKTTEFKLFTKLPAILKTLPSSESHRHHTFYPPLASSVPLHLASRLLSSSPSRLSYLILEAKGISSETPTGPPQINKSPISTADMVSPRKSFTVGKKGTSSTPLRLGPYAPGVSTLACKPARVNWDSHLTRLFLDLAVTEIEQEGRPSTQLSAKSLGNIAAQLSALTNQPITSVQCKNRYSALRRDWQAWQLLANAKRGATGLGFDPISGTYTAPDFFWSTLIAQNELVGKFRERPLDHEDLMQRVFESVTATGKFVYKEGQPWRPEPEQTDSLQTSDDLGDEGGPVVGDADFVGVSTGEEMRCEPSQAAAATLSQRRAMPKNPGRGGNSSAESSKRNIPSSGTDATDAISHSMQNILRNMEEPRPSKHVIRSMGNMGDAMKYLDKMEYFKTNPPGVEDLYWWFLGAMRKEPNLMDMFLSRETDETKVKTLRYIHRLGEEGRDPPPPFLTEG
ncbi:hypothetical protein Vadar_008744 [Vaccinium darrowii]|uniref:Uncharacterized protein n=1 Tax=Vaccinium darrowii TaxID=229202 RepID=A0ACB7X8H9_9ERIC|nr:hypothetical protein Vadar_008744 [Vaccinium darrowii]